MLKPIVAFLVMISKHHHLIYVVRVCTCTCVHAPLRVCALSPLVAYRQVVTLFHQNTERTGLVAVADAEQDLAAHLRVAIVTGLAVHAHRAVYAALRGQDER